MCFDALIEDGHEEKSISQLLREELPSAAQDGGVAALVVVFMLVAFGSTPVGLVAGATGAAFVLAVLVHQAVLVAGVTVRRFWRGHRTVKPTADPK